MTAPKNDRSAEFGRALLAGAELYQAATVFRILQILADTPAPSQTVSYTRAPLIANILEEYAKDFRFVQNYRKTGCGFLTLGETRPRMVFFAHADECSYLFGRQTGSHSWSLVPFCGHRARPETPATAWRYTSGSQRLTKVAEGFVGSSLPSGNPSPDFIGVSGQPRLGDRLVLSEPLSLQNDVLRGSLDNSFGLTACLLAAVVLSKVEPRGQLAFAFTDEEEGVPESNVTFARGARRLVRELGFPELCVNVDGHQVSERKRVGAGALFAEQSSRCRGAVVPPDRYAAMQELAEEMVNFGVRLSVNQENVSRSDDVALFEATSDVLLLGYPVQDPHFESGPPSASLADLIDLSKAVLLTALSFAN